MSYSNKHRPHSHSGRANQPNYGKAIIANTNFPTGSDYSYSSGRNYNSNLGGRSYGQNTSQFHQGSLNRPHSNEREYEGLYNNDERNYRDNRERFDFGRRENDRYSYGSERDRESTGYNSYSSDNENQGFYDQNEYDYDRYEYENNPSRFQYRHEGYQGSGHTEGFGQQGGRGNDWEHEDDYPGGHAQNHRGFGKYGSR